MWLRFAVIAFLCGAGGLSLAQTGSIVALRTTEGELLVGKTDLEAFEVAIGDRTEQIPLKDLLSFQSAAAPSAHEQQIIDAQFPLLDSKEVAEAERAAGMLNDIGLPVTTRLLQSFTDEDGIQPGARYRLYRRILPGEADQLDRGLGLIRLADGSVRRGQLATPRIPITPQAPDGSPGQTVMLPLERVRSLAVQRDTLTRELALDSRQHVTYVEWLNTGLMVIPGSKVEIDATGLVRLSFDEDGWACDADGIHDPLPGKRRLQQGFRWGSILGRIGPEGERWLVGKHAERHDLPLGRLYLVINENERWQNNIGSFRVVIRAEKVFDWGASD